MTQSKLAKAKWTYYPLNSKDGTTFNSQKAMTDNVRVKHEHTTGKGIELVRNFKKQRKHIFHLSRVCWKWIKQKTCRNLQERERGKRGLIMKYIRTKDGHILEVGKTTDYGFVVMPECNKAVHFVDSGNEFVDVVKQANTIEELCDEFVIDTPVGSQRLLSPLYEDSDEDCYSNETLAEAYMQRARKHREDGDNTPIYGAIWTDKGLIYVARLNDKGEWELL